MLLGQHNSLDNAFVKVLFMSCMALNKPVLGSLIRQPFKSVYLWLYNHGSKCFNLCALKGKISWLAHLLCKFGSGSLTTVWLHNRKCAIHISFCRENSQRAEITHQSNCTQSTMQQKLYSDTFPLPCPEDEKNIPFCFVFPSALHYRQKKRACSWSMNVLCRCSNKSI